MARWHRRQVDRRDPTYLVEELPERPEPVRKFPKVRLLVAAGKYLEHVDLDGRSLEAFLDGQRPRGFLMDRTRDALIRLVKRAAEAGDD
jgi:hypothetical protein